MTYTECASYTENELKTEMVDSTENYVSSDEENNQQPKLRKARSKSTIIAIKREVSMRSEKSEKIEKTNPSGELTRENSCKRQRKKSCRRRHSVKRKISRNGSCNKGSCKEKNDQNLRRRKSSLKD